MQHLLLTVYTLVHSAEYYENKPGHVIAFSLHITKLITGVHASRPVRAVNMKNAAVLPVVILLRFMRQEMHR